MFRITNMAAGTLVRSSTGSTVGSASVRGVSGSALSGHGELAPIFDVNVRCPLTEQASGSTASTPPLRPQTTRAVTDTGIRAATSTAHLKEQTP